MIQLLFRLTVVFGLFCANCVQADRGSKVKVIGTVGFRRSYAWYPGKDMHVYESEKKATPTLMKMFDSLEQKALDVLIKFEYSSTSEFFFDKIDTLLKDTVFTYNQIVAAEDTVFVNFDDRHQKAYLKIKGIGINDSVAVRWAMSRPCLYSASFKSDAYPYILYLNQYYIMNGDNYEITVFTVE